MPISLRLLMVASLLPFLGSCGTVCNLAGGAIHPDKEPRIYGGVALDKEFLESFCTQSHSSCGDPRLGVAILGVMAVDPILSFVGDTLTLPITIPLQRRRIAADEKELSTIREEVPATLGKPVAADEVIGALSGL